MAENPENLQQMLERIEAAAVDADPVSLGSMPTMMGMVVLLITVQLFARHLLDHLGLTPLR